MAEAGLDDITTAIKGVLADDRQGGGIAGLSAYAIEPASPQFPCVWPFFRNPAADYGQTFNGALTWHLMLTVAVRATDPGHAQTNLKPYLAASGDRSVYAALEADPSLGLPGVYATVLRVEQIGKLEIAGVSAWGATIAVDILVSPV